MKQFNTQPLVFDSNAKNILLANYEQL
jgi:hypothetical protein